MASGSIAVAAVSIVTISPELIVRTGLSAALKLPMCTVAGLGISVYSAQSALGDASAAKNKLQIKSPLILAIASSLFRVPVAHYCPGLLRLMLLHQKLRRVGKIACEGPGIW